MNRDCQHGQLARACDRCADALEIERMRELADSEGTRAVNYLRRARKAEELLRRCTRHLSAWAQWYGNADHAARGQLPLPPAGDVRLAEDIAEHLTPNAGGNRRA